MYKWRTGRSCVFKNHVHLVFTTKYRKNVFSKEMLNRAEEVFTEICLQMDCELLEFGGEGDHIHIMVAVHPKLAIANLVSKLKGKSSYILRREYLKMIRKVLWGAHFWSPSYCVVSCGGASLEVIRNYIATQQAPTSENVINASKILRKI